MKTRTWPYGTKKIVKVMDVQPIHGGYFVAAGHRDEPGEATMLTIAAGQFERISPMPAAGQLRQMEFRPGGPTGAHWMLLNGEVRS